MKTLLSQINEERVRQAVTEAETRTSGEIVVYVVGRSAEYSVAIWRGAALMVLGALVFSLLVFQFYDGWGLAWLHTGSGVVLLTLVAATLGALLAAYVPPLTRLLAGSNYLDRRVHQRAMQAFVEEEVFDTRERTGILLFVSLLEHRIEVLGDTGINERVEAEDWIHVVERIREGIKRRAITQALVEGIEHCGALLEKSGVAVRADDPNELPNKVRIQEGS